MKKSPGRSSFQPSQDDIYELPGDYHGNEMTTDNTRSELDGIARSEMAIRTERFSFAEAGEHEGYSVKSPDPPESPIIRR